MDDIKEVKRTSEESIVMVIRDGEETHLYLDDDRFIERVNEWISSLLGVYYKKGDLERVLCEESNTKETRKYRIWSDKEKVCNISIKYMEKESKIENISLDSPFVNSFIVKVFDECITYGVDTITHKDILPSLKKFPNNMYLEIEYRKNENTLIDMMWGVLSEKT